MNCQISALTSIRRGLGKDPIPFPVNSNSIIATQNVSGGDRLKKRKLLKATFTKSEGSQSGGVKVFSRGVRNRRGLIVANSEGSKSGGV